MALTPGLYVPQGQVGTGAAYVHEIKDRSGYLDTIAKANEKKRLNEERQIAKLKGFDYGKVTDQAMKEHISQKYKEGLETFSKVVAAGGEIDNISTEEGIQYTTWQNQIKREAETAALAESKIIDFQNKVLTNAKDFDTDLYYAVLDNYKNATTPDEKLAATLDADPLLLKTFDFTKWVKEEIEPAKTDKEITDLGEDITKYQEVYNKKLDEVPKILASKRGIGLAKIAWQMYHDRGDEGFQQASFDEYVKEAIDSQRKMRESTSESPASKPDVTNIYNDTGTPTAGTTTEGSTANVGGLINSPNIGDDFNTGKAFLSTDDNGVETLVLKYNTGNFNDIGLNQQSGAYTDPQDPNAVVVPVKNLWTLKDTNYTTRNLQPEAGKASEFKAATFTDEGGRQFTGVPTRVYKDQLGNLWLDLTVGSGKSASELHVPLQTGDYVKRKWGRRTDKDGNKIYENTKLNEAAEANQGAIATSMGLKGDDKISNFNLFIGKYGPQLEAR